MNAKALPQWEPEKDYPVLPQKFWSISLTAEQAVNDSKYVGYEGLIYNRQTRKAIPPWMPTFTFVAKDKHALELLGVYVTILENAYELARVQYGPSSSTAMQAASHLWAVQKRKAEFAQFAHEHSELMQAPTTSLRLL